MPGCVAPPPAPQPLQQQQAVPTQAAGVIGPSSAPAQACRPGCHTVKPALQPAKGQGGTKKHGSPATRLRTTGSGVSKPTHGPRKAGTSKPAAQPCACPHGQEQRKRTRVDSHKIGASRPAADPRPQGPPQPITTRSRKAGDSQPAAHAPTQGQQCRLTDAEKFAAAEGHGVLSARHWTRSAAASAASRCCRSCQRRR